MKTKIILWALAVCLSLTVSAQSIQVVRVFFKSPPNNNLDNIAICFVNNPQVTYAESANWDNRSLNSGTFLASLKGNVGFAIQSRPMFFVRDTVRLRVESLTTGDFSLFLSGYTSFTAVSEIYLLDNYTNTQHDVKANPTYNFIINNDAASKGMNRFSIVFVSPQISVSCPAPIIVNTDAGKNGAVVDFKAIAVSKCSSASISYSNQPNSFFAIGTTSVTATAYDSCGNQAINHFNITVKDAEAPVINDPAVMVFYTDTGKEYHRYVPQPPVVTDNSNSFTVSGVRDDGELLTNPYFVGNTIIKWTAIDASGNTSTAEQTIIVSDNEPPVINVQDEVKQTGNGICTFSGSLTQPFATDNSGNVVLNGVRSDGNTLSAPFNKGITIITWTATDDYGNTATAMQKITVVDDQPPVFTPISNKNVSPNFSGCTYKIANTSFDVLATDNCSGVILKNSINQSGSLAGAVLPVGVNNITWTATDIDGNTSTYVQTINVIKPDLQVTVADAFVLPKGVEANTIYIGYTPASVLKFTATSGQAYNYQWSSAQNLLAIGWMNTVIVAPLSTNAATYDLTLTVKDVNGCKTSVTKPVHVMDIRCGNKDDKVALCNPSSGKSKCVDDNAVNNLLQSGYKLGSCVTTASRAVNAMMPLTESPAVNAFPNPSSGIFDLQLDHFSNGNTEVRIFDMMGKMVVHQFININQPSQRVKINLQSYATGVYNVQVITKEETRTLKVVVSK